jgi:hypothetical protein
MPLPYVLPFQLIALMGSAGPALLTPLFGENIVPQRPTSDGLGNLSWTDLTAIPDAVFALDSASATEDSVYSQGGSLFVPRGSDITNGDRVTYQGRYFVVVGVPMWDMNHPMTGEDFGYVEVRIHWGG